MKRPSKPTRGLIVRQPHIDRILDGKKTWEIRGSKTAVEGRIALIQGGSGLIVGECEIVRVVGPLTLAQLRANAGKAGFRARAPPHRNRPARSCPTAETVSWPVPLFTAT
jgi:hypothetical protein